MRKGSAPETQTRREEAARRAACTGYTIIGTTTATIIEYEALLHDLWKYLYPGDTDTMDRRMINAAMWLAEHPDEARGLDVRNKRMAKNPRDWWRAAVKVWVNMQLVAGNRINVHDDEGNIVATICGGR